jgi:hypothetical protein
VGSVLVLKPREVAAYLVISPTLLRKIARDIGLTVEELLGRV